MPRFYFHLAHGGGLLIDPEGIEIADRARVRPRALTIARGLIASDASAGVVDLDTSLRIVDEADALVLELSFSDAVSFVSHGRK